MAKEKFNPYIAQKKREYFIQESVAQGALGKIRINERNQNIGILTCLTNMPERQIGLIFANPKTGEPLKRQRINQIYNRFLEELNRVKTEDLKNIKLEELLARRVTLTENGPTEKVKNALENGISDYEQLQTIAGTPLNQIRNLLKKRCIVVPCPIKVFADFEKKACTENDDLKLQEILDAHTGNFLRYYIGQHRKDKEQMLISLSLVAKSAELHLSNRELFLLWNSLKENDKTFPGKILYNKKLARIDAYIIYKKHLNRAIKILRNDPNLQRFKTSSIKLVCGKNEGKFPSIWEVTNKFGKGEQLFLPVLPTLRATEYKIKLRKGETIRKFLDECPIPVFKYLSGYYYSAKYTEQLKEFFKLQKTKYYHQTR
jgi:hypothetical protein